MQGVAKNPETRSGVFSPPNRSGTYKIEYLAEWRFGVVSRVWKMLFRERCGKRNVLSYAARGEVGYITAS